MRKALALFAALAWGFFGLSQIRVLVIDESQTLQESLRLLAVVRALKASGAFSFQALSQFPAQPWSGEPFQAVVYIPAEGPFIWLCSPWPGGALPEGLRSALAHLRGALAQAFAPAREVRGPDDDLYPLFLAVVLASRGYLGGSG